MTAYSQDAWLTPIWLTPGTDNSIVITEDPGGAARVITVTLHQDTTSTAREQWFQHDDTSFHATMPGFLYALQKLLNDGTTVGCGTVTGSPQFAYSWEVSTPTSSTGLTNNGVTLRATAPAADFEITWTNGSSTIDARFFGNNLASPLVDAGSTTDSADEIITWSRATKHRLLTRDLLGENAATDKRRHHYKDAQRSSSRPSDSVSVVWDEGFFRVLAYQDVYGAEIHEDRAAESEWAAGGVTRVTGDNHATWHEVWDALTNDDQIVVVHNSTSDLQVDTHSYEICKLWSDEGWDGMFVQTSPGGDLYDVVVPLWVDDANSDYDH